MFAYKRAAFAEIEEDDQLVVGKAMSMVLDPEIVTLELVRVTVAPPAVYPFPASTSVPVKSGLRYT